jgi:4-methylaminobutanoate oxidase (formaldehyde-forming)
MGYVHCLDGVTRDFLSSGNFQVEVACERYEAEAQLSPFFDPQNERIKS